MSLTGELITLRPIEREDIETLAAFDRSYAVWPETNYTPYSPKSLDDLLRDYDAGEESPYRNGDAFVSFVIDVDEAVVGSVCLWGIDQFNRRAHLGIGVGEDHRGQGFGTDAAKVMLRHAFVDRGLHRVQLEVLADNAQAIRSYEKAGFVVDGTMRESAWVRGALVDEVYMSVLATDG